MRSSECVVTTAPSLFCEYWVLLYLPDTLGYPPSTSHSGLSRAGVVLVSSQTFLCKPGTVAFRQKAVSSVDGKHSTRIAVLMRRREQRA